jgi:hypothetical protein
MDNNNESNNVPGNDPGTDKNTKVTSSPELEEAKKNLEESEKLQVLMVTANKIIRKGGPTVNEQLMGLGIAENKIGPLLAGDFIGRIGFPDYKLTNNNSKLKRLRTRVATLEAKENIARTEGNKTEVINGITLVHNYDIDRIQIVFEKNPGKKVEIKLKSQGFHHSWTNNAWQRKLTNNGIEDARAFARKGL